MDEAIHSLGIVGAGKLGMTLARLATRAGLEVTLANSGNVGELALAARFLASGARASTTEDVMQVADIVVLAVPFHRFRQLPFGLLEGKVVVDAMNHWVPVDGELPDRDASSQESSLLVQKWFTGAKVVRTLNQLGYHDLEDLRRPTGAPDRVAQAVAGDDPGARAQVAVLLDRLGFDAVDAGLLVASCGFGPGTSAFGGAFSASTLRALITAPDREHPVRSR